MLIPFENHLHAMELGFKIFPVFEPSAFGFCSCWQGSKCASPTKHPRISNWKELATTNFTQILEWEKKFPGCNWAAAMGEVVVVDVDAQKGGLETMESLKLDSYYKVKTPQGGFHLYFKVPMGFKLKNQVEIYPGVDTRGDGGYVLVPASRTVKGFYKAESLFPMDTDRYPNLPEILLVKKPYILPERLNEGSRNRNIFQLGCKLRAANFNEEELQTCLTALNKSRAEPPLPAEEIATIVQSVMRYPMGIPNKETSDEQADPNTIGDKLRGKFFT